MARVKNLLVGLPPTDEEVATVQRDPAALRGLVRSWMALPEYSAKMLAFFENAFQQDQFSFKDLTFQFRGDPPFQSQNQPRIMKDLQESFARTVMQLIAEGAPFSSVVTTRRFMMTPALMALYAVLDNLQIDDHYNATDLFRRQSPTQLTLESSRPIPYERSIDPRSPDYMTFYEPGIRTALLPGCPEGTIRAPAPVSMKSLTDFLFDHRPSLAGRPECFLPTLPESSAVMTAADFTDWKMTRIREPAPGEPTTRFFDLASMRAGHDLVLHIPRVGFFSTPAFNARWQTNDSNQARVLMNQTLIVALGKAIDATNRTQPRIPWKHVDQGLQNPHVCHECHVALDPMRQFFRQTWSLYMSRQSNPAEARTPGEFAFQSVQARGASIFDLAGILAAHPLFATAWVQKLCTWADSQPCDETDPEFLRLVKTFRSSHESWSVLVEALFSSPLVTGLQETKTALTAGQSFPLTRQEHLCALLSNRLDVPDVCGFDADTPVFSPVVRTLAASWPSGQYSRGNAAPALPVAPSLVTRGGMENLCADLAQRLVDSDRPPPAPRFSSSDTPEAIRVLVTRLMGLTSDRAAGSTTILQEHFAAARQTGASAREALQSTFVLACLSPYVSGMGQ